MITNESIKISLDEIHSEILVDAKCTKLKRLFGIISNDFLSYIASKSLNINSEKNILVDYISKCSEIIYSFSYLNEMGILIADFIQTILPKYNGNSFIKVFLYRLFIISVAILYGGGNYKAISSLANFVFIDDMCNTHTFSSFNVLYTSNQIASELENVSLDEFLISIVDLKYVNNDELFMADAILTNYELYSSRPTKTDVHFYWIPFYRSTLKSRDILSRFFKGVVCVNKANQVGKIYGFKSLEDFKNKCHEIESMQNVDRINKIGPLFAKIEPNLFYNFIKSKDIGKFDS